MIVDGKWISADEALSRDEIELFGTNDMAEIQEIIRSDEWNKAQRRLTGMEEEQAEWEEGSDSYDIV